MAKKWANHAHSNNTQNIMHHHHVVHNHHLTVIRHHHTVIHHHTAIRPHHIVTRHLHTVNHIVIQLVMARHHSQLFQTSKHLFQQKSLMLFLIIIIDTAVVRASVPVQTQITSITVIITQAIIIILNQVAKDLF